MPLSYNPYRLSYYPIVLKSFEDCVYSKFYMPHQYTNYLHRFTLHNHFPSTFFNLSTSNKFLLKLIENTWNT